MKFKDLIYPFLNYKKDYIRKSTLNCYSSIYHKHLIPYFGEYEIISQKDIDDYLFTKANEFSKKGLESHVVALKTLFKWTNKNDFFYKCFFKANYPFMATGKLEINTLSIQEAKEFAKHCEENFSFIKLSLYTALFTGLRAGEICGLQFKDIDVDRGILSVNKIVTRVTHVKQFRENNKSITEVLISEPKTKNSRRDIPLPKQVLNYYKLLSKIVNPDFYIANNSIKPLEPHSLRDELDKIIDVLQMRKIRLHDLRHTFATRCIALGTDPKTVSLLLGHSTIDITLKLYTHVDDGSKLQAMDKLNKKMSW